MYPFIRKLFLTQIPYSVTGSTVYSAGYIERDTSNFLQTLFSVP